ncbi:MAG: glycosyltransferase family 1 protein [Bacillota bacterium]|nr:glycosyltransferase family 1 protein [Bacillota bacterium]
MATPPIGALSAVSRRQLSGIRGVCERMDEPIRVLQIVTQMNRAGMESRLMDIYRNIDRLKIQFDFYTCRTQKGDFDDEIVDMGGKLYYSTELSIKKLFNIPNRFKRFFDIHKEYKIVHCHMNQWCGLILKGAKKSGVPIRIAHSRTSLEKNTVKNIVKNVVKIATNKYANYKFAVSRNAGQWLFGQKNVEKGEVVIWPNAIDVKKYIYNEKIRNEVRKELDLDNKFTIIHVGNLRPEKNHEFLLEVFKSVLKEESNAKLLIIGKDYLNGAIQKRAKELNVDRDIIFLGSRNDVDSILQAGDVFLFPSFYEGLPGAVIEAQAAGLPCVVSDSISSEICITPLVKQLSLAVGARKWVENILSYKNFARENSYTLIKEKGYDICSLTNKLTEFYINVLKGI